MAKNNQRACAPEANALSRLSYGRIGNSVANQDTYRRPECVNCPAWCCVDDDIRQVLGSNRTRAANNNGKIVSAFSLQHAFSGRVENTGLTSKKFSEQMRRVVFP